MAEGQILQSCPRTSPLAADAPARQSPAVPGCHSPAQAAWASAARSSLLLQQATQELLEAAHALVPPEAIDPIRPGLELLLQLNYIIFASAANIIERLGLGLGFRVSRFLKAVRVYPSAGYTSRV